MSLISRSAGGWPSGKSISGFSMLTSLLLLCVRKDNTDSLTSPEGLHLRQDVDREDESGVLLDTTAGRRVVAVAQSRRNHDQDAAAHLLARQPLRPALDDLLQRERRQLTPLVRRVELLAAVPQHTLVLHQDTAVGLDLVAVALDHVVRHELRGSGLLRHRDLGSGAVRVRA